MQLVARGSQDKYISVEPDITFFKAHHRRHTNFAMESIEQTFNGTVSPGGRVSATISRNGDLVHTMWLEITTDASPLGDAYDFIKQISIEIGGTRIDRQTGDFMKRMSNLTLQNKYKDELLGNLNAGTTSGSSRKRLIPLSFWFCKEAGQALPLIALQYHEVKVVVEFTAGIPTANPTSFVQDAKLWVDYIYLDTEERKRFARSKHEYLIEQVQTTGEETLSGSGNEKVRLNFNHPVKELIWTAPGMTRAKLQLNGHDRFTERDADYFRTLQTYQHHSGRDSSNSVFVYSFALEPEKLQPSGTCNFSRIDNATLNIEGATSATVYAVNYNVLRISNGMGGLAYSN